MNKNRSSKMSIQTTNPPNFDGWVMLAFSFGCMSIMAFAILWPEVLEQLLQ